MPDSDMSGDRGAPRVPRGAPSVGGSGGHVGAPRFNNLLGVAVTLAVIAALPYVFPTAYFTHLFTTIAYSTIVVLGLNVLIGFSGQISLGHAGFYGVGAYTTALLSAQAGWPLWITFPAAVVAAAVAGLVLALPAIRTKGLYLAVMTIAFGFVVEILSQRWVELTGGTMGVYGIPALSWFGAPVGAVGYFYVVAVAALGLQLLLNQLVGSLWGKTLTAVKDSEPAAEAIGIDVLRWKVLAFVVSAGCAGLGGAFFAHQNGYINSDAFTFSTSLFFLVALIVGGLGSRYGAVVGVTVLTLLNQLSARLYEYRFYTLGLLLLGVLIFMPFGLAGGITALARRWRRPAPAGVGLADLPLPDLAGASAPGGVALSVAGLSKHFGGVLAVDGVDVEVAASTIHALIGPNGAGKTTFINLVTGQLVPDGGRVACAGVPLDGARPFRRARHGVIRTFQNLQLFSDLSVADNIAVGSHRRLRPTTLEFALALPRARRAEAEARRRTAALLGALGLVELADRQPDEIAYGHRKLVELGRALAADPTVLLLDEPVAGLNATEAERIRELLARVRDQGVTILLVEHNMDFVMKISGRVTVLNFGQRIAEGTPETVQRDPVVLEAYLGRRHDAPATATSRA
jgi:branched-chain amino acid transport system ATP-binding protein/branched-chain amino acid transport system permease protein